ncbi:interferon-induced very large GTPase 1-like [Dendronephthya gigantea]|uniref:interferon-induced very large GTPase 1-like n=1 Tax=Dendronephthya gigantea TaxID=151771 RepID=UPI00106D91D6|nr:interferon-induced very large GTPase 1-like [Dendronephthya gigantea]XP_028403250.1 interferon-induced very large GTPase 1-like [Dendronephthya gigantea]XP_028403251.1 interferon-induced very large GTPase 1-like [Dendronephthya gigantea]
MHIQAIKAMLNLRGSVGVRPNLKYSLKQARSVNKYTLKDNRLTHSDQIPDYIFNKLMIVDYRVREFKLSNKASNTSDFDASEDEDDEDSDEDDDEETGVHPMDALLGIFHSSDIFLRRYLVTKLSECQLSVPFLLPDPETAPFKNVTMVLSALQNITKSWKDESAQEVFATAHPFPVASFIRLGEPTMSKSFLINKIMSEGDSYHDFFFHRDMEGGNVERKVVDGLVELSWYLPRGKPEAIQKREICFANLRGEAGIFKEQLNVLSKISSVLCIVLSSEYSDPIIQDILKRSNNDTKVILLFEKKIKGEEKKYFDSLKSSSDGKLSLIAKSGNEHKFVQTIQKHIKRKISHFNARPLVELSSYVDEFGIRLEDDQISSEFKAMINGLLENGIEKMKNLMTLQIHIPVLADLEREMYRPKRYGNKFYKEDNNEIYQKIAENENAQKKSLEHLDREILNCLNGIANMDELERYKVFNMMKHQLDKIGGSKSSLGLEHIIRELAQLYQIKRKQNENAEDAKGNECDYAGAVADILLSGQPLELVDGDSFYIPLRWFNAVCTKLKEKTNDAKIFVVSVVGIQSSGKSTLLNTMFGLDFPVSAGRCTKGVFASLIPVSDSLKSNFKVSKFDYVLVVDTEGLTGSSDPQLRERDNELVAFAIGLADVTIVNIMGESSNEMKDFLGIAVHAFLKMKLVEENNKMSCKIVHQNVAAADAEEKLAGNRLELMKDLDKMAELAATQENCKKFNNFNDIISFNEREDVFYLPPFKSGNPPMAPVNPQYGRDVQTIKNGIISLMCSRSSKESCHYAVSHFQHRVTDLWEALQQEHFIFSLRNTIESRARRALENEYLEKSVSCLVTGMAELKEEIDVALRRCSTPVQLEKEWAEHRNAINRKAEELGTKMEEAMDVFFETSEDRATLDKWRGEISEEIKKKKENQVKEVEDNCSKTLLYLKRLHVIKKKQITYEEKIMERAKAFISSYHDSHDKEKLKTMFKEEWQRWIADIPMSVEVEINIKDEMVNVLSRNSVLANKDTLEELNNISRFQVSGIDVDDVTYHISFLRWLYSMFWGGAIQQECVNFAKETTTKAINKALAFAKSESESGLRFTREYLEKMYEIVETTITEETEKYANYSLEFTDSLKCDIFLYTFSQSYIFFDEMQQRSLQEQDIRSNLTEKLRPILENYFENVNDPDKQLLLAATFFVEVLEKQIESALDCNMGLVVARKISKNVELQNKGKFHARVLIKLGKEGKFESYIPYLEYPIKFLYKKLKERIEYYCLNEIKVDIVSLFENEVNKIKDNVLSAIDFANQTTAAGEEKLSIWIQQFVLECSTLVVKKEMFAVGAIEDLDEIGVFQKKVRDNLVERVNSLLKRGVNSASFRKWNPSPHEFIFDQMFTCQSLCPHCNAVCDGCPGHKEHSIQSHRLVGVVGVRRKGTNELSTNTCAEYVAAKQEFENLHTRARTYHYRSDRSVNLYPWVILGDRSLKQSMYWKWFMATFWKELAEHYNATPVELYYCEFITFNDAKEQLMRQYDL